MYTLMWGDTGVFIPAFQLAHKMDYHYQSPFLPRMALFDPVSSVIMCEFRLKHHVHVCVSRTYLD